MVFDNFRNDIFLISNIPLFQFSSSPLFLLSPCPFVPLSPSDILLLLMWTENSDGDRKFECVGKNLMGTETRDLRTNELTKPWRYLLLDGTSKKMYKYRIAICHAIPISVSLAQSSLPAMTQQIRDPSNP